MNTEAKSAKGTRPEFHRLASQFESGASAWLGPIPPRSGSENRDGLKNVVRNLVQLRASEAPIIPLGSSVLR